MDNDKPIAFQLKSLNNHIKRLMEKKAIERNNANLTGMQFALIGYLCRNCCSRDIYQRDVEAEFNVRRSTATGMLQQLEKKEYIKRESDPTDARLKKIVVTQKALEQDEFAQQNLMNVEKMLTKGIPEEEMEQFSQTLNKIIENIKKETLL